MSVSTVGEIKIVKLSGKVGWQNAYTLDKEINWLIQDGCRRMAFNLDEVTFICSGAIGCILYNLNKFKDVGGGIYIISSNDYVNFVFRSTFGALLDGVMFSSFDEFRRVVMTAPQPGDPAPEV